MWPVGSQVESASAYWWLKQRDGWERKARSPQASAESPGNIGCEGRKGPVGVSCRAGDETGELQMEDVKGVKITYLIHWPVGMASGFQDRESIFFFKFYVYKFLACMHVCVPDMCSTRGGQKRSLELLEWELHTDVSCHMGAEKRTWLLCKRQKNSNCQATPPAPKIHFLRGWKILCKIHREYFNKII